MTKVVFTDISYFVEEDTASRNAVLRRLRGTTPEMLAEQLEDALPTSIAMKMMIGSDTHQDKLAIGIGMRMRDEVSACMLVHVNPNGSTSLHISDLSAGERGKGHGSKMMLGVTPVVREIFKPTFQTLEAEGTGRRYWLQARQQMTPHDRDVWQRKRALPFAEAHKGDLDPDTYELLINPNTSTAVLASLDDADPAGQHQTLGHALFLGVGAPTFDCRTPMNDQTWKLSERFYASRAASSLRPAICIDAVKPRKLAA